MNDGLRCPRCGGVFHDVELAAEPDRFWECPLCHVVQHKVCRGPLSDENKAKRIELLEAVAEAAGTHARLVADDKGLGGMTLADFVAVFSPTSSWRILLEALAAPEPVGGIR